MSKYLSYPDAVFKSRKLLLAALADLGYEAAKIEEGTKLSLYGYSGDKRKETAEIVIRRHNTGISSSNDVGFSLQGGVYVPIISEYDAGSLRSGRFIVDLRTKYNERVVAAVAARLNGSVKREQQGSVIRCMVRF